MSKETTTTTEAKTEEAPKEPAKAKGDPKRATFDAGAAPLRAEGRLDDTSFIPAAGATPEETSEAQAEQAPEAEVQPAKP